MVDVGRCAREVISVDLECSGGRALSRTGKVNAGATLPRNGVGGSVVRALGESSATRRKLAVYED